MHHYLNLQYQILRRKLSEIGIHPALGAALALIAFVALCIYLFSKTEFAAYIYALVPLSPLSKLSEKDRNDFLKSVFSNKQFYQTRVLENTLVALPFLIFLGFKGQFLIMAALGLVSVGMAFIRFEDKLHITIPTPFARYPFEFTTGFRKSIWVYLLGYFLAIKSIEVGNFGLGIFSLILVFLVGMSHYLKPESPYFVWIYETNAKGFLVKKMAVSLLYATILTLPILLALIVSFPDNLAIVAGIQGLGYLFIATMVLAKYAAFPGELNLPQAILFSLCFFLPPMLLIVIPIFYTQAIKRLNPILK